MGNMISKLNRLARRLRGSEKGITLIEIVVATCLSTMLISCMAPALLNMVSGSLAGDAAINAQWYIQNAANFIMRDGQTAQQTDLVDGGPSKNCVYMTWTQWSDFEEIDHYCSYYLSDDALMRDYDGEVITVARDISDIQFSLQGSELTVTITAAPRGDDGDTIERTWKVTLRTVAGAW